MIRIRQYGGNDRCIEVPLDDYTFNAVIVQGPIVSRADHSVHRDALVISSSHTNFIFKMTLLESSRVFESFPSFGSVGLLGTYTLMSNGFLKFVRKPDIDKADKATNQRTVQEFLMNENSAEFIRALYK